MRGSLLATSLYGQWGTPKPGSERPEAWYPDVQGEAQRGRREGGGEACRCNEMEWAEASGEQIEGGG